MGPIGTPIQLRVNQNLGASPALLSFKAVVSRGVPARLHVRLSGAGSSYSARAPIQMCIQGGGTWEAELVLTNGRRYPGTPGLADYQSMEFERYAPCPRNIQEKVIEERKEKLAKLDE